MMSRSMDLLHSGPDVSHAARSGPPTMTDPKRTLPASIPAANNAQTASAGGGTGTTEVSATPVGTSNALETKPDARTGTDGTPAATTSQAPAANNQPLPTNRDKDLAKMREIQAKRQAKLNKKKKKKTESEPAAAQPNQTATPAAATPAPAATTPAAAPPQS
jgi:hypothetical protein